MAKISALDLNGEQTKAVEDAVGLTIQLWGSDPSVSAVEICRQMLAAYNGDGIEKYRAMTNRTIVDLVDIDEDVDPNPRKPRAR